MNIGNYLFGFDGRINRAKWWLFLLVAIVYWCIIYYVVMRSMGVGMWVYLLLQVPLYYMAVAVGIKRLHDRNKGAIWALVFYGVPIAISIYQTYTFWGAMGSMATITATSTPEEIQAATQAATQGMLSGMGTGYMVMSIVNLVIGIWALVELGILKGTTGDNQYGPDPLAGK